VFHSHVCKRLMEFSKKFHKISGQKWRQNCRKTRCNINFLAVGIYSDRTIPWFSLHFDISTKSWYIASPEVDQFVLFFFSLIFLSPSISYSISYWIGYRGWPPLAFLTLGMLPSILTTPSVKKCAVSVTFLSANVCLSLCLLATLYKNYWMDSSWKFYHRYICGQGCPH